MQRSPQTYALLIGIDQYLPTMLPDSRQRYSSLHGCVRDAEHMEELLQSRLALPDQHIIKLLAPNSATITPSELNSPQHRFPTYAMIVAAFQRLLEMSQAGDFIFIYFAGHGTRATSMLPELKEIDEALVPLDACSPQGRYLHDVELAYLLKKMGDAGLVVTVILDSCFSGGTTRGSNDMTIRGMSSIDRNAPRGTSLVASPQVLADTWSHLPKGIMQRMNWFPAKTGYVLLAACRATEQAYEYPLGSYHGHGVFTYWLLDAFQHLGPNSTYQMLHARVRAQVHTQFEQQTPLIIGEAGRLVFGSRAVHIEHTVSVMKVDINQQQVLLNVGDAHALVGKGSKFALYPAAVTDFSEVEKCLAIVKIVHLGGVESLAHIEDILSPLAIEPGAQAVLRDPGEVRLQRSVRLFYNDILPSTIAQGKAFSAVEQAIRRQHDNFVRLATNGEMIDYQVAINAQGGYEIWDPAGMLMQNIHPTLYIDESGAAEKLVRRLIHLTKYRNILQCENTDRFSPLANKLVVTLKGKQVNYIQGEQPAPVPFEETDGNPTLGPDEWTFLSIKNVSKRTINMVVFDLAPDWSIQQIFPDDEAFHTLDPGAEYILALRAGLPPGLTHATDVLKVIATIGSTDLQWLQLPTLDQHTHSRSVYDYTPASPLEELLFALMQEAPGTRNLIPGVRPTREWVTAQLAIDIKQ